MLLFYRLNLISRLISAIHNMCIYLNAMLIASIDARKKIRIFANCRLGHYLLFPSLTQNFWQRLADT